MQYEDIFVVETNLKEVKGLKGLYIDGCVAIEKTLNATEKSCVLAEEIGHHLTSSGNILDQTIASNRKQEHKARMIAFDLQVGLNGIIEAYEAGCTSLYMTADYLCVTVELLTEAVEKYRMKHGLYAKHGDYIIYFEPVLGVMKLFTEAKI
jgi:hypothetical protein